MGIEARAGTYHYGLLTLKPGNYSEVVFASFAAKPLAGLDSPYGAWIAAKRMTANSTTLFEMLDAKSWSSLDNVPEKLREVMRLLAISKKTLCSILDVSRPALYSWLDNSSEPAKANSDKIDALFSLVKESGISAPLFRGYVERPIEGFPSSIVDCLLRKEYLVEASSLPEMLRAANALSREREKRIEARNVTGNALSEAEKDLILEDNLNSL